MTAALSPGMGSTFHARVQALGRLADSVFTASAGSVVGSRSTTEMSRLLPVGSLISLTARTATSSKVVIAMEPPAGGTGKRRRGTGGKVVASDTKSDATELVMRSVP